jgi:hypothetical protein
MKNMKRKEYYVPQMMVSELTPVTTLCFSSGNGGDTGDNMDAD